MATFDETLPAELLAREMIVHMMVRELKVLLKITPMGKDQVYRLKLLTAIYTDSMKDLRSSIKEKTIETLLNTNGKDKAVDSHNKAADGEGAGRKSNSPFSEKSGK